MPIHRRWTSRHLLRVKNDGPTTRAKAVESPHNNDDSVPSQLLHPPCNRGMHANDTPERPHWQQAKDWGNRQNLFFFFPPAECHRVWFFAGPTERKMWRSNPVRMPSHPPLCRRWPQLVPTYRSMVCFPCRLNALIDRPMPRPLCRKIAGGQPCNPETKKRLGCEPATPDDRRPRDPQKIAL